MKVLIANIGSTSFKFRLFDMPAEKELARGGVEQVGSTRARCYFRSSDRDQWHEQIAAVRDHSDALEWCLEQLGAADRPLLRAPGELAAIGFKTVVAQGITGVQFVDKRVLGAMEAYANVAPAHNPAYVTAMRTLRKRFPEVPLVAAFETGFHETIPEASRLYGLNRRWADRYGIRRHGFHGASHRYVAQRMAELLGRTDARIISCHLGGSSSICAIRAGCSVANSFGFSPQSGVPHGNRVGDLDPYALLVLRQRTGKSIRKLLRELAKQGGLRGLSGISGELREIEQAAQQGNPQAQLAIDVFVSSVRHYIGGYLVELGGAEVMVFTGGIGENSPGIRWAVSSNMGWLGVELDAHRNQTANGEALIARDTSPIKVWTLPANEELVVARQVVELLSN